MAAPHRSVPAEPLAIPQPWSTEATAQQDFLDRLRQPAEPLLICDYDGTLAPFQVDKMQAHPYPGVAERLERIAAGPSRLAFVSGRPVGELLQLLPLAARTEVWGMHGREHRTAEGNYSRIEPTTAQRDALDQAQAMLTRQGLENLLERKAGSVALHWRTLDPEKEPVRFEQVRRLATEAFALHAGKETLALLPFDGGLELRAEDRTKAHATEDLLGTGSARAAAFLGDDLTDEDAFRVIRERCGLALLVRETPRPSHAQFQLRPPGELLAFLDSWLGAVARSGSASV